MKAVCVLLALGLVCAVNAAPARDVELLLRKLSELLKRQDGGSGSMEGSASESMEGSGSGGPLADAPIYVKLMVLEHIFSELAEKNSRFEELMLDVEEQVSEAVAEKAPEEILALLPEIVKQIATAVQEFFGVKFPADIAIEDLKLFIKLHVVIRTVYPYVESQIEAHEEAIVAAMEQALASVNPDEITSAELFEKAFGNIASIIAPSLAAIADELPAELENVRDLMEPIVQFHVRVQLLKAVIVAHVPGVEEELQSAVFKSLKFIKNPVKMFMYVCRRMQGYVQSFGSPELAMALDDSMEAEEIIKEAFEEMFEAFEANKVEDEKKTLSSRGLSKFLKGLNKASRK